MTVVRHEHLDRRAKAKSYYGKTTSEELAPLVPEQFVYRKPNDHHRGGRWNSGEVLKKVTPRSYLIKIPGGLVRRSITHPRPAGASLSRNRQPLAQQAVPTGVQNEVLTSERPHPTPVKAGLITDRSVGATPSPVDS